ncbi:MAG TPA: hypothetical protein PK740_01070, partial [Bacteroidales bacterium]|nr:hypothetical protein [Bacteroidales bacterium]
MKKILFFFAVLLLFATGLNAQNPCPCDGVKIKKNGVSGPANANLNAEAGTTEDFYIYFCSATQLGDLATDHYALRYTFLKDGEIIDSADLFNHIDSSSCFLVPRNSTVRMGSYIKNSEGYFPHENSPFVADGHDYSALKYNYLTGKFLRYVYASNPIYNAYVLMQIKWKNSGNYSIIIDVIEMSCPDNICENITTYSYRSCVIGGRNGVRTSTVITSDTLTSTQHIANEKVDTICYDALPHGVGDVTFEEIDFTNTTDEGYTYATKEVQYGIFDACFERIDSIADQKIYRSPELTISVNGTENVTSICSNTEAGYVKVNFQGGKAPYNIIVYDVNNSNEVYRTFTSETANDNFKVSGLAAGTYYIEVKDLLECTKSTGNIVITNLTVDNVYEVTLNASEILCNGDATDITPTIIKTSGTPDTEPLYYLWSNEATTATLTGVPADSYALTVTDEVGCIANASITVTEPDEIVTSATVDICGNEFPYTYTDAYVTNKVLDSQGTHTFSYTTGGGCEATHNVTVTEIQAPIVTLSPLSPICIGETLTLSVNYTGAPASMKATWLPDQYNFPVFSASPYTYTFTPTETDTYTITEFLAENGCYATLNDPEYVVSQSGTVNLLPVLTLGESDNVILCNQGTLNKTFTPQENITYAWSAPEDNGILSSYSGTGDIANVTVLNNGDADATVIISVIPTNIVTNCSGEATTFTVTVKPTATMDTQSDVAFCSGQTAERNFTGANGVSYQWTAYIPEGCTMAGVTSEAQYTGNISAVVTNTTAVAKDIEVGVIPYFENGENDCYGETQLFAITVNPMPSIANQAPEAICSGEELSLTSFEGTNIIPDGTTYTWTVQDDNANLNETANETASANFATGILINSTNSQQSVTYTVTAKAGDCSSTPFDVEVKVNPTPSIANTSTSCNSGASFSVTPVNGSDIVPDGTTYSWVITTDNENITVENPAITNGTTISQTLTNTSNIAQEIVYTVTPTSAEGCEGNTFTVTVTIAPKPFVEAQTVTICENTSISMSRDASENVQALSNNSQNNIIPDGTQYIWVVSENTNGVDGTTESSEYVDNFTTGTLTHNSSEQQTVVYSVTPKANGVEGDPFTVTVTVNPNLEDNITANSQTVCSGTAYTTVLGNVPASNMTCTWTVTDENNKVTGDAPSEGTPTSVALQTLANTETNINTVTYHITAIYTNGVACSVNRDFVVTVNPNLNTITANEPSICDNASATATLTNAPAENMSYEWTVTDAAGITGDVASTEAQNSVEVGPLDNTTTGDIDVNYSVTPIYTYNVDNTCRGTAFPFVVNVNPTITANTMAPQTLCNEGNTTEVVFGTNASGEGTITYEWTNSAAEIGSETADNSNSIASFTAINNTAEAIIKTITVTPSYNGCPGTAKDLVFTVNPEPQIGGKEDAICSGQGYDFAAAAGDVIPVNTQYKWTVAEPDEANFITGESGNDTWTSSFSTGTLINTTNETKTVTYTVTSKAGTCTGVDFTVTITVNPTPSIPTVAPSICSGTSFSVTPADIDNAIVPVGTTYSWIVGSNDNITGQSASSSESGSIGQALYQTTNTLQSITYTVTATAGECISTFPINVTVKPIPVIATPQNPPAICSGSPLTITSNGFTGNNTIPDNTTYTWTVTPNDNVEGEISHDVAAVSFNITDLTNTTYSEQSVVYAVTPDYAGCQGSVFTINVSVNPKITGITAIPQIICNNSIFGTVELSEIPASNMQYTWTVDNVAGVTGTGFSNQTAPVADIALTGKILTNNNLVPTDVTYQITPYYGANCAGTETFPLVVTVNPTATMSQPNSFVVCTGATVTEAFASDYSGQGFEYSWEATGTNDDVTLTPSSNTGHFSAVVGNATTEPHDITITVTPQYNNENSICSGVAETFTITVIPDPQISTQPSGDVICEGGTHTMNITANVGGGFVLSYQWQKRSGADTWNDIADATSTSYTAEGLAVGDHYYRCVVSSTGSDCNTVNSDEVTVTVVENPTVTVDVEGGIICNVGSATMTATITGGAASNYNYQWQYSTSLNGEYINVGDLPITGITYSGNTPEALTVTASDAAVAGTYYFRVNIDCGSNLDCDGISEPVAIEVAELPTIAVSEAPVGDICPNIGTAVVVVNLTGKAPYSITPISSDLSYASPINYSENPYTATLTYTIPTDCGVVYNISLSVTDANNCVAAIPAEISISVNDEVLPSITGTLPEINVEGCAADAAPAAVATIAELESLGLTIEDNCTEDANLTVTSNDVSTGTCPIVVTRTYTVTDACGNESTATQTINVNVPNNITFEGGTTSSTVNCAADAIPPHQITPSVMPTVKDACGTTISNYTSHTTPTTVSCEGEMVYEYTYTDCAGHTATWLYTYTIDHTTAPTEAGGPVATASTVECADEVTAPTLPVVEDACGNILEAPVPEVSATPACEGTITYTYTYEDCSGLEYVWAYTYTID